jgi:MFS transporter, AAHS family, 4-hydroxybenzoate transporter
VHARRLRCYGDYFRSPLIKTAWGINQTQIGWVLSSALFGMAAGSLLIAPAADLIGRRRMIFLSLVLMLAGDFRSAMTQTVTQLALARVVTGLGIGSNDCGH